jgi:hypothetical protein
MQFQVPQFIDVEDKIFGPLTIRQFIYIAGGVGLCVLIYFSLPIYIAVPLILPIIGFSLALAFYKINNKPFIDMLESAVMYVIRNKLYIWKKEPTKRVLKEKEEEDILTPFLAPKLSDSKLKDLAWSLDVTDKITKSIDHRKPF